MTRYFLGVALLGVSLTAHADPACVNLGGIYHSADHGGEDVAYTQVGCASFTQTESEGTVVTLLLDGQEHSGPSSQDDPAGPNDFYVASIDAQKLVVTEITFSDATHHAISTSMTITVTLDAMRNLVVDEVVYDSAGNPSSPVHHVLTRH